jgi:hypothetical protein
MRFATGVQQSISSDLTGVLGLLIKKRCLEASSSIVSTVHFCGYLGIVNKEDISLICDKSVTTQNL